MFVLETSVLHREQDRNFCLTSIELVVFVVYIRAARSAYKIWLGS